MVDCQQMLPRMQTVEKDNNDVEGNEIMKVNFHAVGRSTSLAIIYTDYKPEDPRTRHEC